MKDVENVSNVLLLVGPYEILINEIKVDVIWYIQAE